MLRYVKTKVVKEEFYCAKKKKWDLTVNNIVISKMTETKNNSKYLIRYLDEAIKWLVLMLQKISGYFKISNDKDGDKDKNKNNELMYFGKDNNKLLQN